MTFVEWVLEWVRKWESDLICKECGEPYDAGRCTPEKCGMA